MKKGFTLAEIMIALVVIGVITSILLPVAFNNIPNENVMKFKKGNATLAKVINELVTSGEYYKEGDLGIKADGTALDSSNLDNYTYFFKTFNEIVSSKNFNTIKLEQDVGSYLTLGQKQNIQLGVAWSKINDCNQNYRFEITDEDIEYFKEQLDGVCALREKKGEELTTIDDIEYFESGVGPFGIKGFTVDESGTKQCSKRFLSSPSETAFIGDKDGFDIVYKVVCMDIDGLNKGEEPFGYGIRADGKIILGKRATEWLEKSIQDK